MFANWFLIIENSPPSLRQEFQNRAKKVQMDMIKNCTPTKEKTRVFSGTIFRQTKKNHLMIE